MLNLVVKPESLTKGGFDEVFVGVSFPRAPVTLSIIIYCFESPATTFRLVKATRLIANPDYYVIRIIIIVLLYF